MASVLSAITHTQIAEILAMSGQRYTSGRRRLIEALALRGRPSTIFDIMQTLPDMPQSSAYRHLTVLSTTGVVRRFPGNDDLGYFELSDELSGQHHHHVLCEKCGNVVDVTALSRLEKALSEAAALAAEETGYLVEGHRIDLFGLCPDCQRNRATAQ